MSSGKRLAKRSIVGTRVCAPGPDGLYQPAVIQSVKKEPSTGDTYVVRFEATTGGAGVGLKRRQVADFRADQLVGPGFRSLAHLTLPPGQKVFLTYNGREIAGHIVRHQRQQCTLTVTPPGLQGTVELKKRLEEVRLLESRKSARLMDQDTDFARLADMAADRKRASSTSIDVPSVTSGSRKRRTSSSYDDVKEDQMNECTAALVLMSLSCSPNSPLNGNQWMEQPLSPSASLSDCASWRSGTPSPSPPLSETGCGSACGGSCGAWGSIGMDEGIVFDEEYDQQPRKKKVCEIQPTNGCSPGMGRCQLVTFRRIRPPIPGLQLHARRISKIKMNRTLFQCTWPRCMVITTTCDSIEAHVRTAHLGRKKSVSDDNGYEDELDFDVHEEEFYYTEVELEEAYSPPTLSHRDMARPPHEDPEYQKTLTNGSSSSSPIANNGNSPPSSSTVTSQQPNGLKRQPAAGPISIPKGTAHINLPWSFTSTTIPISASSPVKHLKLSFSAPTSGKLPASPTRRIRGETKKCRKVYGMEHRDLWCTQCKWKKACTRFND